MKAADQQNACPHCGGALYVSSYSIGSDRSYIYGCMNPLCGIQPRSSSMSTEAIALEDYKQKHENKTQQ